MNTVCASTYLYLLQFLFAVPYNFLSTGFHILGQDYSQVFYFFFEAVVTGIVFLISLSVSLLLAYKNATDFFILILYPATLVNSFISSSSFLVESLGFSIYSIMSSANKDRLLLPFQFGLFLSLLVSDICGQDFQYYVE